jgi:DNA polymerase elongation subunit (family B)
VFKDERAMLLAFAQLVSQIDPDILVGYEVQMSSLGYLIERGYALRTSAILTPSLICGVFLRFTHDASLWTRQG